MLRVSDLAGRRIDENHSEPLVNRHSALLGRENGGRRRGDAPSSRSSWTTGPQAAEAESATLPATDYAAPVGGTVKRLFDVGIALTTLFLMAPLLIVIALLIYFTMGGPVFFVQRRVGFNRASFDCYKFRTMVTDADARLKQHLAAHPDAARAWAETQKLKDDPRVTWLGQILRKSSLDELPQLFNVLRGHMSCIGPRPVLFDELTRYGPHAGDYLRAKPGVTGMWQVNGRSSTTYEHRINCDRYYVRRWSMLLDIAILFKTIPAVLKFDETA